MSQQNHSVLGDYTPRKRLPSLLEIITKDLEEKRIAEERKRNQAKEDLHSDNPSDNPLPPKDNPIITPKNIVLEDYVFLPGKTHSSYSYQDTLVSMYRLGMSPEVETIGNSLGYNLNNTAKEKNNREYIGNINWKQALTLNLSLGGFTLSLRQFADFILLLKSGNVLDGNKKPIQKSKLSEILNEIIQVRAPLRLEWLDADFKYLDNSGNPLSKENKNGKLWLYSSHKLDINKNLIPSYKNELESYLTSNGNIDLSSMNKQGMPTKEGNEFYYEFPYKDNNSVVRFVAYSDRAVLNCGGSPASVYSSLGVRRCLGAVGAANFLGGSP